MSEVNVEKEIIIMQSHLKDLRKLAGWTSEELGHKLGMSKQAISALENGTTKLNQLHYLALLYLFETECKENPRNEALKNVLELLFNDTTYYEKNKTAIDKSVNDVANAISTGLSGAAVGLLITSLLNPLTAPIGIVGGLASGSIATTTWAMKILQVGKKRK